MRNKGKCTPIIYPMLKKTFPPLIDELEGYQRCKC